MHDFSICLSCMKRAIGLNENALQSKIVNKDPFFYSNLQRSVRIVRMDSPQTFSFQFRFNNNNKLAFCIDEAPSNDFFKWAIPGLFLAYFRFFQTNITIFPTSKYERGPSRIQCWDLNPRPSEHASPPITTRPELPPCRLIFHL